MDNKTIYKRTIGFSIRRLLWDVLAFIIMGAVAIIGFAIAEGVSNKGLIGLAIGAIVGLIIVIIMMRYISYSYKAAQIAMMTKAIADGKLPKDVIGAGKKVVKERFSTVAAYFAVTGVIKGIFSQIGQGITAIGQAVGGDSGGAVGSTISSIVNTIVDYLCDCCLGWVFYRSDVKATKATCEGAVLFFKHGKTLAKNLGRVFGIGLLSFIVIGGVFFGVSFLILHACPDFMTALSKEIIEAGARIETELPGWVSDVNMLTAVCAGVTGVIMWGIIHSTFIRPFVLVGVLRNFINSGKDDIPSEKSFDELDKKSKKFKKLHEELAA